MRDQGANPVRSRRRLYSTGHHREEQCTTPNVLPAGISCAAAAVLLCPICEITVGHWDLPRKSLGVYATSGAWHTSLPQGLPIEGRSPVGAVAADSAFKEAGLDLFSRRQPYWRKRVPLQNWYPQSIAKDFPMPLAAFANYIIYKLNHAQALLKFLH